MPDLARRALMEGIGTFALVFAGCGAIVADATRDGALGAVGISLVFGLVIMVMIYAGGHLSGAHYNPSVTLAFTLARHFPPREALALRRPPSCSARSSRRCCCSRPGATRLPTSARRCPASAPARRCSTRSCSRRS